MPLFSLPRTLSCLLLLLAASLSAWADNRAAWSPDGRTVAITLSDLRDSRQWVSFWDATHSQKTGPDIKAPPGVTFTSPVFSHDGRLLALGRRDGKTGIVMQVFDTSLGAQQLQYSDPEGAADVLGFSSDDSLVLLRLPAGSVVAVDVGTGQRRTAFGRAELACVSPDGRWLALAGAGGIHLLDLSGQQNPLDISLAGAGALAFSPDGQTLAVLTPTGVSAWDTGKGALQFRQGLTPAPASLSDSGLQFGSDRHSLLVRAGDHLYVLDGHVGGISKVIGGIEAGPVLLSDPLHPERALVGGGRHLPLFWNIYFGGHQPFSLDAPAIRAAALSHDGRWLVAGLSSSLGEVGMVYASEADGSHGFELPGVTRSLGFAGSDLLATDDGRGRLLFWSLDSRQLLNRVDRYCPRGESRLVAASELSGTVLLRCDDFTGGSQSQLRDSQGHLLREWPQAAIGMSPSGMRIAFAGDGGLDLVYLQTGELHKLRDREPFHADRVAFSADESHLTAIDAGTGIVHFFDQAHDSAYMSLVTDYSSPLTAEALGPDLSQFLAVADGGLLGNPQPVRHWELGGDHRSFTEFGGGHTGRVVALLLERDGKHFITAGTDNRVRRWGLDGGNELLYFLRRSPVGPAIMPAS